MSTSGANFAHHRPSMRQKTRPKSIFLYSTKTKCSAFENTKFRKRFYKQLNFKEIEEIKSRQNRLQQPIG